MDIDYQVGEVELSYKSTVREKRKIATSSDAYGMLLSTFREDTIGYKEYFIFFIISILAIINKEEKLILQKLIQKIKLRN